MRAYVITAETEPYGDEGITVVGVVSNRKDAIKACETYVRDNFTETGKINWIYLDKHSGTARRGTEERNKTVSFEMFFINGILREDTDTVEEGTE